MAQIILIEDNKQLLELITLNLTTYASAQVIPRSNADDAISLLTILPEVEVIICQDRIDHENTAEKVLQYLRDHDRDVDFIVLGTPPPHKKDELISIPNSSDWEAVVKQVRKLLGIDPSQYALNSQPEYVAIKLDAFYLIDRTPCEVYIRIKKSPNEYQYVKRFHGGDVFNQQAIKRYEEQGLKNFFIPKSFLKNFTNYMSDHLLMRLRESDVDSDELINIMGGGFDFISKEIKRLGFNSATLQLTEAVIGKMVETVEENSPEMSELLFRVINAKTSYIYQHAHLTAVMAAECLKELGVTNKKSFLKIAYAAFFQNITLVERDDLAKISSYEELEMNKPNEKDWELVLNHAHDAANLVSKNPDAPIGVDEIIRCHHGSTSGKGYAKVDIELLPGLTRIFVLAADFAKLFLDHRDKSDQKQKLVPIVKILSEKYQSPEVAKIIRVIEQVLQKKKISNA